MTLRWGGSGAGGGGGGGGVWIFLGATQLLSYSSNFNPFRLCIVADG